jgi:hypothetical protein
MSVGLNTTSSEYPAGQVQSLREKLKPLEQELAAYRRELPRLLAEGEKGRWAVVKGDQVLATWDTYRDASQYAREKFPVGEPLMIQQVDPRHAAVLEELLPADGVACPS